MKKRNKKMKMVNKRVRDNMFHKKMKKKKKNKPKKRRRYRKNIAVNMNKCN